MTRLTLRVAAIAIALAGLVDPAIIWSGASRPSVAIVLENPAEESAARVRARLVRELQTSYDVTSEITSDAAAAIVIGDGYPVEPVRGDLIVATVTTVDRTAPGVRLVCVDAPREVPAGTTIHVEADVEGIGTAASESQVTVQIAGLDVGRLSHRWSASPERWRAVFDVVPVGDPPFVLRTDVVSALPSPGLGAGSRTLDDASDHVVDVRHTPLRVQIYEPRPSWAATFVRRALEGDPRFQVAGLSYTSRNISSQTPDQVTLTDPRLDAFDVVIVGGLDRVSAADARSLDHYMRQRGGTVVLLPDQRVGPGPVRDLVGSIDLTERLLERPSRLAASDPAPPIQASELLVISRLGPGAEVIAAITGNDPSRASASPLAPSSGDAAPVVVSLPHGDGRLVISGAMDAWRFRAEDNGAFDRFWRSTIAGLALASPPPIDMQLVPPLLQPNERGEVVVRVRSGDPAPVSASIDGEPIRLRPEAEEGLFRGALTASSMEREGFSRASTVRVQVGGSSPQSVSRTLLVQQDVRRIAPDTPALSMLAASHRGIDVTPDRLAELVQFVRRTVSPPPTRVVRRPMRSAWWGVPFVACLSAEWFLRRRRGLR